ncbi:hypothetical protein GE061_010388, partial [Apolygus lucorum]
MNVLTEIASTQCDFRSTEESMFVTKNYYSDPDDTDGESDSQQAKNSGSNETKKNDLRVKGVGNEESSPCNQAKTIMTSSVVEREEMTKPGDAVVAPEKNDSLVADDSTPKADDSTPKADGVDSTISDLK